MTPLTAKDLIRLLQLRPLEPEGGFFRETYRSAASTAIYYLLTPETFSALHRLPTDEVYHFYLGDPVEMLLLKPDGSGEAIVLGPDLMTGQRVQFVVPENVWQGSCLRAGGRFALLGTTMAPGFEFATYEAAVRHELAGRFPSYTGGIQRLTREN